MSDVFDPDTDPAPTENYRPLPTAEDLAEKPQPREYSGEADGLREAAKDLTTARAAAEAEPIDRSYRHDAGLGEPLEPHFTLEPRQAADDLERVRQMDAARQQTPTADVAEAIDAFRNQLAADPQPDQAQAQPQAPTAEQTQATEQPVMPDGIDPEIAQALNNPKIRAALESEVKAADDARAAFAQGARQAAQVAAAAVLSNYPELATLNAQELPHALAAIAKLDPAKATAIEAQINRVRSLYDASQQAQAAQQQIQAQNLKQWVAAEDAKFTQATANETPETMRKIAENIIALAQDYGVSKEEMGAVWQSQPILRSSAFQRMMVDAARYRMATSEIASKIARPVPVVQRPGVAGSQARDSDVESAMRKFNAEPGPKTAANLLIARRAAANR